MQYAWSHRRDIARAIYHAASSAARMATRSDRRLGKRLEERGVIGRKRPAKRVKTRKPPKGTPIFKPPRPPRAPTAPALPVNHHYFYTRGKYRGAFNKRFKRRSKNVYLVKGSLTRIEDTFEHDGTNVAEVGHSTCVGENVIRSVGRAILRGLLEGGLKTEIITDWTANPRLNSQDYSIVIRYRTRPDDSVISATGAYAFSVASTFSTMGDQLMNEILPLYTTSQDIPVLESIEIFQTVLSQSYLMPIRQAYIRLNVSSLLRIQNLTENSATGGTDAHDVRANPLVGRVWSGRGNMIIPHAGSGGFTNVYATHDKGEMGEVTSVQARPHEKNFYINAKSCSVNLAPGEIKKSFLKTTRSCSVNKMMWELKRYVARMANVGAADPAERILFGQFRMYEFEHMIKNTTDPNVKIACELDVHVMSFITWRVNRECREINET
jgi:hypothetical protein